MQKQQIPLKNSLLLLLAAIIWGIAFVAQSVGMKYVGGFTFNAVRSLIGAVVLIPLIFILPHYLGLQGVEMCQAVADLLTFILAIPLTCSVLNEMKRKQAEQL